MRVRALRPLVPASNDIAQQLTCPPYDVVTAAEARNVISLNPTSFMSVVRPDATLPPETPPYDPSVYAASAKALKSLQDDRLLVRDSTDTLYVYQQRMGDHVQRGLVALTSVHDYDEGLILRHEKTRPDKEDDRTKLTDTLSANTGPVFLTYNDDSSVDELVEKAARCEALFEVRADDGVHHTIWRLPEEDAEVLVTLFEKRVAVAYIADGHHRAASAARVARSRLERAEDTGEPADCEWFLSVLFPKTQLNILPYNRLVKDLNNLSIPEFCERLGEVGQLTKLSSPIPAVPAEEGTLFIYIDEDWHSFVLKDQSTGSAGIAQKLDCSILQRKVLSPILGIEDPRKSNRIEFVGGIRGLDFLERQVQDRRHAVAFALHPVTVRQLMAVADSGEIMPPKSTWFEPKLRSGFFVHTF